MKTTDILLIAALALGAYYVIHQASAAAANNANNNSNDNSNNLTDSGALTGFLGGLGL